MIQALSSKEGSVMEAAVDHISSIILLPLKRSVQKFAKCSDIKGAKKKANKFLKTVEKALKDTMSSAAPNEKETEEDGGAEQAILSVMMRVKTMRDAFEDQAEKELYALFPSLFMKMERDPSTLPLRKMMVRKTRMRLCLRLCLRLRMRLCLRLCLRLRMRMCLRLRMKMSLLRKRSPPLL